MDYNTVCETALATPGLLINVLFSSMCKPWLQKIHIMAKLTHIQDFNFTLLFITQSSIKHLPV